jgi:Xaa-Pro aminopeptidase
MIQEAPEPKAPDQSTTRLMLLRQEMRRLDLHGFLVPRADEYQNEYVPPCGERLWWLTGFSGSAGTGAVLLEKAAIFVDGRYVLQAQAQVQPEAFTILKLPELRLSQWLEENVQDSERLGYDPRLHSSGEIKTLSVTAKKKGFTLTPVALNLIDCIWTDRPLPPLAPVRRHDLRYSGKSASDKIAELKEALRKSGEDAALVTGQDSIAWLFNIRGADVPHTPLALSFAMLYAEERPELFIDDRKLTPEARAELSAVASLRDPGDLLSRLAALGPNFHNGAPARVRIDPARTSQWFISHLNDAGAAIVEAPDLCLLPKARKNTIEIDGARAAHHRDGVALCRFLSWLDAESPSGKLDELAAADKLESFRRDTAERMGLQLMDLSFDTISGAGPNGAIVHYRAAPETNRKLEMDSLYLIDSGGQYLDGTTDVTRTVSIGSPSAEMRRHFTLVLKGHIAIATARFPKGVSGRSLDAFARRALWQAGLDYDHGTGHGVGSYLSVHEGPQSIGKRGAETALEPGMILSNEPGYYREGHYGIRIENLLLVTQPESITGGELGMMGFETLTLAPIDPRLVEAGILSRDERQWLNAYHLRVLREIGPQLSPTERSWLESATTPIDEGQV